MSRYFRTLALLAALPLAACSSSVDPGNPNPGGGGGGADAGTGTPVPQACTVESSYPNLGALMGGSALVRPQDMAMPVGPQYLTIGVSLGGMGIIDAIFIEMWDGFGAFAGGFAPGTYQIVGPEIDLNDCGACVWMAGDLNMGANTVAQRFMASGGTVTIDAIDPTPVTGRVTGSLANISLREVSYAEADGAQSDVPGGCTTSIEAVGFDLPVVAPAP